MKKNSKVKKHAIAKKSEKPKNNVIDCYGVEVDLRVEIGGNMIPIQSVLGSHANFIESISVRIALMEMFNIEVKICPPHEMALKLLNSGSIGIGFQARTTSSGPGTSVGDGVEKPSKHYTPNKMSLQIHYGGRSSPVFKAYLLMPDVAIGEDGLEVTMRGVGLLFAPGKTVGQLQGTMSSYDAIEKLLKTDEVVISYKNKAAEVLKASQYTADTTSNSMEVAKKILRSNNCKMLYAGGNGAGGPQVIEIMHIEETKAHSSIFLRAFGQIDPNNGIYPIVGMQSPLTNLVASGALNGMGHTSFDKKKKETTDIKTNGETYSKEVTSKIASQGGTAPGSPDKDSPAAATSAAGSSNTDIMGQMYGLLNSGTANMAEAVRGLINNWMESAFELDIETIGVPYALPAKTLTVDVKGVHAFANKQYDIKSVEHTISAGGMETKFGCVAMAGIVASVGTELNEIVGKTMNAVVNTLDKTVKTPTTNGQVE